LGEILIKAFVEIPGRANPKGAFGGGGAKPIVGRPELPAGTKPRNRGLSGRSGASALGNNGRWNGRWVLPDGNVWIPAGRYKLRRVNPMSAAGVKQNRLGFEGSKPSRGQPNPEGGT
jgi:hypothetical protein